MGKFSDYVGSINEQTEMLRQNLTDITGEDCSKMSIGSCANVIASKLPDSFEDEDDGSYVRPEWYPDPKEILNTAPNIVVNGTTYYPAYIMLMNNYESETAFHKAHSTSSSAVNYYRGTGGDAVLCSDRCDNDIANASAETLEVGNMIMHAWDLSKDIEDPSGKADYRVRWVIVYVLSKTNNIVIQPSAYKFIELITGECGIANSSFNIYTGNPYAEYIEFQENTYYPTIGNTSSVFKNLFKLKEIKFNCNLKNIDNNSQAFKMCYNLSKITLPNSLETCGSELNQIYSLKTLIMPDKIKNFTFSNAVSYLSWLPCVKYLKVTSASNGGQDIAILNAFSLKKVILSEGISSMRTTSDSNTPFYNCYNLEEIIFPTTIENIHLFQVLPKIKYLKIPSSVTKLTLTGLTGAIYIELFNDFDISGVSFNPMYSVAKSLQWLKDLCIWLKDRTGETANTMVIGEENIKNAQRLWLTFNPNDKRDITWVDAGTEGAINIVEFITTQLNWTLS